MVVDLIHVTVTLRKDISRLSTAFIAAAPKDMGIAAEIRN
jgi:hypothetical protein